MQSYQFRNIRVELPEIGETQGALADAIGRQRATVNGYETGALPIPASVANLMIALQYVHRELGEDSFLSLIDQLETK